MKSYNALFKNEIYSNGKAKMSMIVIITNDTRKYASYVCSKVTYST